MNEIVKRIGDAKSVLDNGFSRIGRGLKAQDSADKALMILASRCVAIANAIMLLAKHNHVQEALPLLRSLLWLSAHARWVAAQDSGQRARDFLQGQASPLWETLWEPESLRKLIASTDFPQELEKIVAQSCGDHLWGNAQGLPWGHLFADPRPRGMPPEVLLETAAACMEQVIRAVRQRWPKDFESMSKQ